MARLKRGERENRRNRIYRLLQGYRFGLRESEIAAETGLHRRVVNNYLRELQAQRRARKEGRYWFSE